MAGEVEMKFVSDARQLLADIEKQISAQDRLEKKTGDMAKAVAARRKEQGTMAREAIKLEKEMASPIEKYKARLAELDKLHKAGAIGEETHRRAVVAAWKSSGLAAVQAEKALKREQVERAKIIEIEKRQAESTNRRARYEEALAQKQKQVLREIETPLERYNAKMRDLNRLLKTGQLNQDQYGRAVRKVKDNLEEQINANKHAIDLGGIESLATRWLSVGGAIVAATTAISDYHAAAEEAAQRGIQSRMGMGSLAQVAKSPEHFLQLQEKVRQLHREGGAESEDQGARIVFALESAGEMNQFELFKEMRASGLVAETDVMARAAKTMQASMGEKETGSIRSLVSKAFGASKYAPTHAEALLEAAARSGGSAQALGMSDEEVLAATAMQSTTTGSAERGGTNVASLLRSLDEKREQLRDEKGNLPKTLRESLLAIQAKKLSGEGLQKLLGREEAVTAYRGLLLNLPRYDEALAGIRNAQDTDEVGRRLKYHETDPSLVAARGRVQGGARLGQSTRGMGTMRNISESFILNEIAEMRERGRNEALIWLQDKFLRFKRATALPVQGGQDVTFLREQAAGPIGVANGGNENAAKFLEAAEKLNQAADNLRRASDKMNTHNPATSHGDRR